MSKKKSKRDERLDRVKGQRMVYARNRNRIMYSQTTCGICGLPVDKTLKYPDPLCATVDHIIPLNKGGTNALANLQLAHHCCNRQKSDKLYSLDVVPKQPEIQKNTNIPQYIDWSNYGG